jgi:hypothetical protein
MMARPRTQPEPEAPTEYELDEAEQEAREWPASTELAVPDQNTPTLFGTNDPVRVVEEATRVAKALAAVVEDRKLFSQIRDKKYVRVEGWLLLGAMLGVFPQTEWSRTTTDSKGAFAYESAVVARTRDGSMVGRREAMCSRSEDRWKIADDYAIRSMSQTRATSGALSGPLRFIMELAGYSGTPEEEMPKQSGPDVRVDAQGAKPPPNWSEALRRFDKITANGEGAAWLEELTEKRYGVTSLQDIDRSQRLALLVGFSSALMLLEDTYGDDLALKPGVREKIQSAFAEKNDSIILDGPPWALEGAEAETYPQKEEK